MTTPQAGAQSPSAKQPAFSFLTLVKEVRAPVKSSRSRTVDPLSLAKEKILKAIDVQKGYVALVKEGKPLPKAKSGEKTVGLWFRKHTDGWAAAIRYGQVSIPIIDGKTEMLVGKTPNELLAFYDAVAKAVAAGELDAQIAALQEKKSAALKRAA